GSTRCESGRPEQPFASLRFGPRLRSSRGRRLVHAPQTDPVRPAVPGALRLVPREHACRAGAIPAHHGPAALGHPSRRRGRPAAAGAVAVADPLCIRVPLPYPPPPPPLPPPPVPRPPHPPPPFP